MRVRAGAAGVVTAAKAPGPPIALPAHRTNRLMPMAKIKLDEIVGLERYEQLRGEWRQRIIELKKARRVAIGDRITLVFENHDTMLFQTQEMLRAERIVDLDRIREEIDVYNELIPNTDELSATMLIEITDSQRIRDELVKLIGIDEALFLHIGEDIVVQAQFEPGRSKEDKLSAVQYVRFPLAPPAKAAFCGDAELALVITHPNYAHRANVPGNVRASLIRDLHEG